MPRETDPALALIDARGLRCPWPVLRAQRAMRAGRPFALLADDPVARNDVPLAVRASGWSVSLQPVAGGGLRFMIAPPADRAG